MTSVLDHNLDLFLRGPGFADEGIADFRERLERAWDESTGLDVTLTPQEVAHLWLVLRRGDRAAEEIRRLIPELWKLRGMPKLRDLRSAETLACNYEALVAGGLRGDGRVCLKLEDEHLAGRPGDDWFEDYELGGPVEPKQAVMVLKGFYGVDRAQTIVDRLWKARAKLGPEWHDALSRIPSKSWKPAEEAELSDSGNTG